MSTSSGNRPFTADGILLDGAGYVKNSYISFYSFLKQENNNFIKEIHLDHQIEIKKDFKEHLKFFNM